MHRKTSLAAAAFVLAAVSACSKPEPAADATTAADVAAAPAAAATWTPALPTPGAYEVSSATGEAVSKVSIEADYSYSQQPVKGLAEAGIVKLTDGKVCFDPSGKEKPTRCYTESVRAADGSFTATDEKGVVENIKPAAQ
jgi:hypothetical protein